MSGGYARERVWSSLPVPAFIVDEDDNIAEVNPAAELFVNTSAKALRGVPLWDRLAVDAMLDEAFSRVRSDHAELFINDVFVTAGTRAPVQCNIQIAPLIDARKKVLLLISPREIAGRLGRGHSSKAGVKSAIGMAQMLAHEIKNPLAGIAGAAQLLSMNLSKDDLELTDLIVAETRRIVKLLDQVEQFGNMQPPKCKAVNIHDLLDRAQKSALVGFASHLTLQEQYDPSLPPTFGDGDQLLQVFLNLLKNAAQAAPADGGTIKIRTFYDHSLRLRNPDGSGERLPLQVEIEDDGPGIPADIVADIFDPFVSGRENGTGLGLALVSKIISDHGGWIAVDSVPRRTVFRISLPVATSVEKDDD